MIVHIVEGRKTHEFEKSTKVLVDVFRSTTTMPIILMKGAREIVPTATVKEARSIRRQIPDSVMVGERYGIKIPGFDLNNSPTDVMKAELTGKIVIFTSTNGTHVLRKIANSGTIYVSSFVNATATARVLGNENHIDIVVSGRPDGSADEDQIFAEYLRDILLGNRPDFATYGQRVRESNGSRRLRLMGYRNDIEASLQLDMCNFPAAYINERIVRL